VVGRFGLGEGMRVCGFFCSTVVLWGERSGVVRGPRCPSLERLFSRGLALLALVTRK
jgi:hypothetical protein